MSDATTLSAPADAPPAKAIAAGRAMKPSFTAERGAALCIAACLDQIAAGHQRTLATDDREGPHQLRIGLRRLRTALGLFRRAIGAPVTDELASGARWLGQQVGRTRDLEVMLQEKLEPALRDSRDDPAAQQFLADMRATASQERARLRMLLTGRRVGQFLRDLQAYATHRGWLLPDDIRQTERLALPLGDLAGEALADRWKTARAKARHVERLSPEQRHALRKELKKLRYSVDFLAPLYPARQVEAFLNRLKAMQDIYGDWNDAVVVMREFDRQLAQTAIPPDRLGAVTRLIDNLNRRAAAQIGKARKDWIKLQAAPKPWA